MAKFRMDVDQKRYFCTLCSEGSITRAAQSLYLSRQGLSKSMKSLESQLGAQLFVRGKKGVELTAAGRILLRYLHEEGRLWDACVADIRSVSQTDSELVRVGLLSMYVGYSQKRGLLASFQDDPRVKIEVVDGDHDAFWKAIAEGELELAFSIKPPDDLGLPSIKLCDDGLSVLLSASDPLSRKRFIDFETDLRGKTVIQTSPCKGRLYEATFRKYGINMTLLMHDKNLMLAQVSISKGCFIIQTEYAKMLVTDQVCMRPLINAPIEMDSMLVFAPALRPMASAVRQGKRTRCVFWHIISDMTDEDYMRMAIEEARRAEELDEVPIGAVVVYEPIDPGTRRPLAEPQVIARACNLRETTQDPAGHAEFIALKQAAERLGVWRLTGCTVYVTLEPCVMCAGLMHQARVDRCVYGAADPKAGALGTLYAVNADERLNHTFEAVSGVLGDECAELLRSFFARKRKKRMESK